MPSERGQIKKDEVINLILFYLPILDELLIHLTLPEFYPSDPPDPIHEP
jgi:hypothetical protein